MVERNARNDVETTPEIARLGRPLVLALPAIYAVTIPASYLLQHHADLPGRWTVTGSTLRPREAAHSADCKRWLALNDLRKKLRDAESEHNERVDTLTKEHRRVAVEARIAKEAALDSLVDECLRRTQGDLAQAGGAQ